MRVEEVELKNVKCCGLGWDSFNRRYKISQRGFQ